MTIPISLAELKTKTGLLVVKSPVVLGFTVFLALTARSMNQELVAATVVNLWLVVHGILFGYSSMQNSE